MDHAALVARSVTSEPSAVMHSHFLYQLRTSMPHRVRTGRRQKIASATLLEYLEGESSEIGAYSQSDWEEEEEEEEEV